MLKIPEVVLVAGDITWTGFRPINTQRLHFALVGSMRRDEAGGNIANRPRRLGHQLANAITIVCHQLLARMWLLSVQHVFEEGGARAGGWRALDDVNDFMGFPYLGPGGDGARENLLELALGQVGHRHIRIDHHGKDDDGHLMVH